MQLPASSQRPAAHSTAGACFAAEPPQPAALAAAVQRPSQPPQQLHSQLGGGASSRCCSSDAAAAQGWLLPGPALILLDWQHRHGPYDWQYKRPLAFWLPFCALGAVLCMQSVCIMAACGQASRALRLTWDMSVCGNIACLNKLAIQGGGSTSMSARAQQVCRRADTQSTACLGRLQECS